MNPGNELPKNLPFREPPRRVVSLVPSLTESLFDLGLGAAVAGITDYCLFPEEAVAHLPRLGGPKNPRLDEILALQPDLVLANWEENTRSTVTALEAAGIPVWVTFPQSVRASLDVLWDLAAVFRSQAAAVRLRTLELTLDWAQSAALERRPVTYFCPIWFERQAENEAWWMTFNQHTYCHDLLHRLGGQNVFAARARRYPLGADLGREAAQDPGERDTRYPRVTLDEIHAAQPELILLPDEPFAFTEAHRQEFLSLFKDTPAGKGGRSVNVDGSLITWHGTRLARAIAELPALFYGN